MMWLLRLALLAAASIAALAPASARAELRFYYCYAPDVESGTVYMSQVRPVGPMEERGTYGAAFSAYLKAKGITRDAVQAYCTMRDTAAEVERSQRALAVESCPECGGASKFEHVAWNPDGKGAVTRKVLANKPSPEILPRAPVVEKHIPFEVPVLVIMGNGATGDVFIVRLGEDPQRAALAEADKRGGEWETLYLGREPYVFVSMSCIREGEGDAERVRFFVGDDLVLKAAQAEALESATAVGELIEAKPFPCGKTTKVAGRVAPKETTIIDYIKGVIRREVTCDADLPGISRVDLDAERGKPEDQRPLRDMLKAPGAKPCVIDDRPGRGSSIGVRG